MARVGCQADPPRSLFLSRAPRGAFFLANRVSPDNKWGRSGLGANDGGIRGDISSLAHEIMSLWRCLLRDRSAHRRVAPI